MEEELNENDLEERLYALIHHVDETQAQESVQSSQDASPRFDEARSTVRRYWRSNYNGAYQKINTPKGAAPTNNSPTNINKNTAVNKTATVNKVATATPAAKISETAPKDEKSNAPVSPLSNDLLILKNTVPQNYEQSVEILDNNYVPNVIELEMSDEDEVIEVELPPKPTITIESSDEDDLIVKPNKATEGKAKSVASKENKSPNKRHRDVSASPVPSVVSSMSDEFIRGDCLAFNISSAQPDNGSFDFSLHGVEFLGDGSSSKKKRKKKSKDRLTSIPIAVETTLEPKKLDSIFATPKSKVKNKKQKKSYAVTEKSIPNADVYDSDSNQSVIDLNKNHDAFIVEKSFPSADVYESDSSVIETIKNASKMPAQLNKRIELVHSSDSNTSMELSVNSNAVDLPSKSQTDKSTVIDLTEDYTLADQSGIEENIVIGNVSGFTESEDYGDDSVTNPSACPKELGRFCSTKVPQILYDDLDFDNLKGNDKVCRRRRYSLTNLRAEMEKFYNESWGGENFNHQELQKNMSRDKSLWVIDPKDRMPNPPKRRVTCNFCHRPGHRDDMCRVKQPVCHMCGHTGHYEPRCPRKICVNCGSPNFVYSKMCRNCSSWGRLCCAECGQPGHPASHCPDLWRRYHNTIDENMAMENSELKAQHQLFCSGCARRGHLVHACRAYVPFCTLPIASPLVARYWRLYPPPPRQDRTVSSSPHAAHKRHSKSPTAHETHTNKKRISESDDSKRRSSQSKDSDVYDPIRLIKNAVEEAKRSKEVEKAPDYIPVTSTNYDNRGHVIQDNEVSDTSEIVTSARVYITNDVFERLQTEDGQRWLKESTEKFKVDVHPDDAHSFLTIKGMGGDQEAFQSELREWTRSNSEQEFAVPDEAITPQDASDQEIVHNIPKKRMEVLRILENAFESLRRDIGNPKAMYKELLYLQNHHESLIHQKVVSPGKVSNNRDNINMMLKKLNMVLLGQAGLAHGSMHLAKLQSLQEKLMKHQYQKVPLQLRKEISLHYQNIFTAVPRDDYRKLLRKFYVRGRNVLYKNEKKKNRQNQMQQKQHFGQDIQTNVKNVKEAAVKNNYMPKLSRETMCQQLIYCGRKLLNARTDNKARNRHRLDLVTRIQNHVSFLKGKEEMNGKKKKKIKKAQEQAQMFLTHI